MGTKVMTEEQLIKLWEHMDDGFDKGVLLGCNRGFEMMWWASLVRRLRGLSLIFRVWSWVELREGEDSDGA